MPMTPAFIRKLRRFAGSALIAAALAAGFAAPAAADSADGVIARIDANDSSLTLDNGKTYKLPGEFDYSGFRPGQKVTVFYDSDPSGSYISDIEVQGAKAADTDGAMDNSDNSGADGSAGAEMPSDAEPDADE